MRHPTIDKLLDIYHTVNVEVVDRPPCVYRWRITREDALGILDYIEDNRADMSNGWADAHDVGDIEYLLGRRIIDTDAPATTLTDRLTNKEKVNLRERCHLVGYKKEVVC